MSPLSITKVLLRHLEASMGFPGAFIIGLIGYTCSSMYIHVKGMSEGCDAADIGLYLRAYFRVSKPYFETSQVP